MRVCIYGEREEEKLAKGKERKEKRKKKNGEIRRERVSTGHHISGVGLSRFTKGGEARDGGEQKGEEKRKKEINPLWNITLCNLQVTRVSMCTVTRAIVYVRLCVCVCVLHEILNFERSRRSVATCSVTD